MLLKWYCTGGDSALVRWLDNLGAR